MHRTAERRRVERRLNEMNTVALRQEALLRDLIRAEVRAYNHVRPTAAELVLREGVWDTIKGAVASAAEFGKEVAQDFKKGWERVSSVVSEALASISNDVIEKVKSFIKYLKGLSEKVIGKVREFGEEKVRRFLAPFKKEQEFAGELKLVVDESKTNGCVENAVEALGDKAEEMNSDSAKTESSMAEGRRIVAETRSVMARGRRKNLREGRRLLKEAADPFSVLLLGFGGVMLFLKALAGVIRFAGGPCSAWANKAAEKVDHAYHLMHEFEEAALDTLIPDAAAVLFYDFYIFCGFAPVQGDVGKMKKSSDISTSELYGEEGTDKGIESGEYEKGKLVGKMGAKRDVKVKELEGNDKFRRAIKSRMYQVALLIMLGKALFTIAQTGLTIFYSVKSAVKAGELGLAAAGEVSAAVRKAAG